MFDKHILIGINIYLENIKKNHFSPPLLSYIEDNIFIGQIISSNNYSLFIEPNSLIKIDILKYPNNFAYQNANISNNNIFEIYKTYNFICDINEFKLINDDIKYIQYEFSKLLDESNNLNITFSIHYLKESSKYILSTPSIVTNITYFN